MNLILLINLIFSPHKYPVTKRNTNERTVLGNKSPGNKSKRIIAIPPPKSADAIILQGLVGIFEKIAAKYKAIPLTEKFIIK